VITPVKDMEIALLQQPPRDPRHPSLLPFSHSLNKKRCLSPFSLTLPPSRDLQRDWVLHLQQVFVTLCDHDLEN